MIALVRPSSLDDEMLRSTAVSPAALVDDHYDYSQVVVRKPWGYEYLIYANTSVAVWILFLKAGAETSMHCHPQKKTSLIVLQGEVTCRTLSQEFPRSAGDGLLIERGAFHQTRAASDGGAFVMEIETPVNKRDLVRLNDKYGRAGLGYESSDSYSHNTQNYNYISFQNTPFGSAFRKHFGECGLTFQRVVGTNDLKQLIRLNGSGDVITLLAGTLLIGPGEPLSPGDTRTVSDIRHDALQVAQTADVLLVKRLDRLIKVSDLVARTLKSKGISDVFLVPGEANVHLLDSIGRDEDIRFLRLQTEKGASLAAEGFAKLCGKTGCLVISSGGSGPNALPGVANAWVDSAPLIVLSGQARSDQNIDGRVRQLGNKSFPITDVVKSITKYAATISDASRVRSDLEAALDAARSDRPGPSWIDLPIDVQGMALDEADLHGEPAVARITASRNCGEHLAVLDELRKASRPIFLAGNGIRLSGAEAEFSTLIGKLQIPVLTSRRGADLLAEDHPMFFGRPGSYGQRRANFVLQNADLVLSVGCRLSIPLIGRSTEAFARAARKIVVDIDPGESEKTTVDADLSIHADAKAFMRNLSDACPAKMTVAQAWLDRCSQWRREFAPLAEGYAHTLAINPYLFIASLADALAEGACIVVDGGAVMNYVMQVFRFKEGQRLVSSTGLELHGFALPGAIGASLAKTQSDIICICEDRGFQLSISELQTIVDYRLPIKIFLLNSKGHATLRNIQKDFFGARFVATDTELRQGCPSFRDIASAFGCPAQTVSNPDAMRDAIQAALTQTGPTLCEVMVDSEQGLIPRLGFSHRDDGQWVMKPLEDMYPFLDRERLRNNMIVPLIDDD